LETVFSAEKRFLCETATEVLDAIILYCSDRKLALVFLQLNETYSKYQDLRLYNLTCVYVEKCVHNWNKPECYSLLHSSQSSTTLLRLLATMLISKSAPGRLAAQKSFKYLRDELGVHNFEAVLRVHLPLDLQHLVLKDDEGLSKSKRARNSSKRCEAEKRVDARSPTIVQSSPSILQRMLLHRQNRVLPKQT
ncbi:Mannitol dehydrogenase, partial [Phytophthora palmivora]